MEKASTCATQGLRKYLKIAEEFTKYSKNISISSLIWSYKSQNKYLEIQNVINGWLELELLKLGSILCPFCRELLWNFIMNGDQVAEMKEHFPCLPEPALLYTGPLFSHSDQYFQKILVWIQKYWSPIQKYWSSDTKVLVPGYAEI